MPITLRIKTPNGIVVRAKPPTILTIKAPKSGKKASYSFDPNEVIFDKIGELEIHLQPSTDLDHDASIMDIYSYCCTETDIRKIRATSFIDSSGMPNSIAAEYDIQKLPISTKKVKFHIDLEDRQFAFIGIIVRLVRNGGMGKEEFYLCDPQVGNGPPGSALVQAVLLDF